MIRPTSLWRLESRLRGIQLLKAKSSILGVTVPLETEETVRQIVLAVSALEAEVERQAGAIEELNGEVASLRRQLRHHQH